MKLERIGARVYVRGAEFGHRDALKAAGAKWDPEKRMWWAGVAKRAALEAVIATVSATTKTATAQDQDPDCRGSETVVIGRATYKDVSYYVLWAGRTKSGEDKIKLVDRKGEKSFWLLMAEVVWNKSYGRPRSHPNDRIDYPTIGSLAAYAERMKRGDADDAAPTRCCWECGRTFTAREARQNDGDWSDNYCGC